MNRTITCDAEGTRDRVSLPSPETSSPRTPGKSRRVAGFTLLELIIVIAVVGILAAIALPRMLHTPKRAAEATLKTNLRTFRDTIDQFYADKGHYPPGLEALVDDGYLRRIPIDPITKSADTWVLIYEEIDWDAMPAETDHPSWGEPGVVDVRSGAEGRSLDGTPYGEL
jgi:general secretion pathway protein G